MDCALSGLQIIIAPQADPSFDSTWTGWPRALLDESAGKAEKLFAAVVDIDDTT